MIRTSPYFTSDAASAKVFLVPQYSIHEFHMCIWNIRGTTPLSGEECRKKVIDDHLSPLFDELKNTWHWKRSHGIDHLFVFPHDHALDVFYPQGWPNELSNVSYVGYIKNAFPTYPHGFISIPAPISSSWESVQTVSNVFHVENNSSQAAQRLMGLGNHNDSVRAQGCNLDSLKHLFSFFGTVHKNRRYSRGVRQDLSAVYLGKNTSKTWNTVFHDSHTAHSNYKSELLSSRFCLCPPGWAPWSPRIYHALASGCIPVIYTFETDFNMDLPFRDYIDWDSIVIKISAEKANQTAEILSSIPDLDVCKMRRAIAQWVPMLLWSGSPETVLMGLASALWKNSESKEKSKFTY
jgi:hypothetical protein